MNQNPRNPRLRRLNIRLLITFHEMLALGELKVAAEKKRLTRSAVSHALRRLSNILGFQLFVRRLGIVVPTDRPAEIALAAGLILTSALGIVAQDGCYEGASDVQPS
jgi:DNA-binding transcriptional LysR family regulator